MGCEKKLYTKADCQTHMAWTARDNRKAYKWSIVYQKTEA